MKKTFAAPFSLIRAVMTACSHEDCDLLPGNDNPERWEDCAVARAVEKWAELFYAGKP